MIDSQISTLKKISSLAESAQNLLSVREEIKPKMPRTFSRPEAVDYLKCDYRTINRYASELGIDPESYKEHGIDWMLDLEQIYKIRDALPASTILKKQFKEFQRSKKQSSQRVVIQNQKGGVGKTISTITVATGLAVEFHQKYSVLIVDMDGQSTLSSYQPPLNGNNRTTIGELMQIDPLSENYISLVKDSVSDTTIPNLKILPAAQGDRDIEALFHQGVFSGQITEPYKRLNSVLDALGDEFDIVLIDTPPSLGYSAINSYFAATSVIFPLGANQNDTDATCQYLSYLPKLYKTLIKEGHKGYDFIKMLVTNHEVSSSSLDVMNEINSYFGDFVFSTQFKKSEAVRECALNRNSVFDLSVSTYQGKTKKTLKNAKLNAFSVVQDVIREINIVWKRQGDLIDE